MNPRWITGARLLWAASALSMGVALFLVFLVAPREAVMGDVQRVFYFHVPTAWVGYLALFVSFTASALYLVRREARWDRLASSSVEIGLLFITQGIITGSVWAKATWGVWWTWEPRLTTSAVLWLIYASYLTLRRAMEDQGRRARVAAVYSILGFVAVPVNLMAIRWWRTVHPLVFEGGGANLSPAMLGVLVFSIVTFTLFYCALLSFRLRLAWLEERVQQLRQW
ncbi:MAG: cytochrome c biogenesis protein CcsA [Anaerolineae bacterium]|nr:cytochrome c biogenesis protein CcsA [Anaerolineae bacterium]